MMAMMNLLNYLLHRRCYRHLKEDCNCLWVLLCGVQLFLVLHDVALLCVVPLGAVQHGEVLLGGVQLSGVLLSLALPCLVLPGVHILAYWMVEGFHTLADHYLCLCFLKVHFVFPDSFLVSVFPDRSLAVHHNGMDFRFLDFCSHSDHCFCRVLIHYFFRK